LVLFLFPDSSIDRTSLSEFFGTAFSSLTKKVEEVNESFDQLCLKKTVPRESLFQVSCGSSASDNYMSVIAIFSKICENIRNSRCTAMGNLTAGPIFPKFATGFNGAYGKFSAAVNI
jgi:hypothetical protein